MDVDRPLFSARYGLLTPERLSVSESPAWAGRHAMARVDTRIRFWCDCPGGATSRQTPCGQGVTQEDFLCDECRKWCYAVDGAGNRYPFVSLYGAAR